MIVAELKPIEEIMGFIDHFSKIAIAACGTCVTVCMSGGEKEANELASAIKLKMHEQNKLIDIKVVTPKRQCDKEFLEDIAAELGECEAILSLGCGAGIQFMAEYFQKVQVFPGVNTSFIGVARDVGIWTEMCQGCGDCILEKTGGICPITRCSKSNLNGPCGGSSGGKCEVDPDIDCGWQLIYDKLSALGKLDNLLEIIPPKDWRTSRDGGPRKVVKKEVIL